MSSDMDNVVDEGVKKKKKAGSGWSVGREEGAGVL